MADALSKKTLVEILELAEKSGGSFIIMEKDEPKVAIVDFKLYTKLLQMLDKKISVSETENAPSQTPAKTQKILITQSPDALGGLISTRLTKLGHEVVSIDQQDLANPEVLKQIFEENKFDIVFHLAQLQGHKQSIQSPEDYFTGNVEGTMRLLKAMNQTGVDKIINRSILPVDSPFGHSQKLQEQVLNFYHQSFGISSLTIRLPRLVQFNAENLAQDAEILVYENPVEAVLLEAAGKISDLPLPYSSQDHLNYQLQLSTFEQAVDAFIFALEYLEEHSGAMVYTLDSIQTTLPEIIDEAMSITGKMLAGRKEENNHLWQLDLKNDAALFSTTGWQPQLPGLTEIISSIWSKLKESPEQQKSTDDANRNVHNNDPISLSELMNTNFTPFIKPHN